MKNFQLTIALGIALTSNIFYPLQLNTLLVKKGLALVKFIPPPPPPDRSAADSRSGAASRLTCSIPSPIYKDVLMY